MPPGEKGLTWDENTIQAHDKERGGKMKIDEPKTPYNYDSEVSEVSRVGGLGRGGQRRASKEGWT